MPHTKTPGGQAASDKFLNRDAAAKGLGAENAPGHTEGHAPGEAAVVSDSFDSNVGVEVGTNQPGESSKLGAKVGAKGEAGLNDGKMKN